MREMDEAEFSNWLKEYAIRDPGQEAKVAYVAT
jgi:hypothetical protein